MTTGVRSNLTEKKTAEVKSYVWRLNKLFCSTDGERQRLSALMRRRECCSSLVISLIAGGKTHRDTQTIISPLSLPKPLNESNTTSNTLVCVCARELDKSLSMQRRALSKAFSPNILVINTRPHLSELSDHLEVRQKRGKKMEKKKENGRWEGEEKR